MPEVSKFDQMKALYDEWRDCKRCPLHERRLQDPARKLVFGWGKVNLDIMFVGEGPGKDEEVVGLPFIGKAGGVLDGFLKALEFPRDRAFITNAVCCRSCDDVPDDRGKIVAVDKPPAKDSIEICRERLFKQIYIIDPLIVVALGRTALKALTGQDLKLDDWVGHVLKISIPGRTWKDGEPRPVSYSCVPTYHPSFILKNRALEDKSPESLATKSLKHLHTAVTLIRDNRQLGG